jgi:Ribbon-helix-helix domain
LDRPCLAQETAVAVKKRRTFMIEPDILDKLRAIKDRTGLSESEQVRQGIRWWLESREWPPRRPDRHEDEGKPKGEEMRTRKRR